MGACMLVRREAVEEVGPLDESFFLFSEETDWCYRFGRAGWKVLFFPGAECVHVGGAAHGGRMLRENLRGHLRFLAKHRGERYAERARRLLSLGARAPRPRLPRRARADVPRRGGLAPARGGSRSCSADDARCGSRWRRACCSRREPSSRARSGCAGRRRRSRGRSPLLFGALLRDVRRRRVADAGALPAARGRGGRDLRSRGGRPVRSGCPGAGGCWRAGALLGLALWHVAGEIGGDGLFHLARVRKLEEFDSLSLGAVTEFADGGLHPGYAFPLWHGFLALVAKVSFLDPSVVVLHEASVLAPLAVLVAYEAGYALFRAVGPAVAVVLRAGGGHRARARSRRRVHGARPARDRVAPTARPGRARARARLRPCARPARCSPRPRRRGSCSRSSTRPTRSSSGSRSRASSSCGRSSRATRRGRSRPRSRRSSCRRGLFFAWLLPVVRDTTSRRAVGE